MYTVQKVNDKGADQAVGISNSRFVLREGGSTVVECLTRD